MSSVIDGEFEIPNGYKIGINGRCGKVNTQETDENGNYLIEECENGFGIGYRSKEYIRLFVHDKLVAGKRKRTINKRKKSRVSRKYRKSNKKNNRK
jgi:hypothetical protein